MTPTLVVWKALVGRDFRVCGGVSLASAVATSQAASECIPNVVPTVVAGPQRWLVILMGHTMMFFTERSAKKCHKLHVAVAHAQHMRE